MHKGSVNQVESDQRNRGVPFPGDFSDWHSDTPGGTPEDVQWEVQQLAQLRYEPAVRHELLRLLMQRREGGNDVVEFDYLPVEVGFDTVAVKGELLITAESYLGVPYLWGGTSAGGIDCSGLTQQVYRLNGVGLDRDADQQALGGRPVDRARPGDLFFFGADRVTHTAIATGARTFIDAPESGKRVQRGELTDPSRLRAIRRFLP